MTCHSNGQINVLSPQGETDLELIWKLLIIMNSSKMLICPIGKTMQLAEQNSYHISSLIRQRFFLKTVLKL